jgi:hypothetical protein
MTRILKSAAFSPFFISFISQNEKGEITLHPENEGVVRQMNNNLNFYYFCIDIRDYIFQKPDNKGNVPVAVLPKYLCIKTFYPSADFYSRVFKDIVDYVTMQRCLVAKSEKTVNEAVLQSLNSMKFEFEDSRIEGQGTKPSQILLSLQRTQIGSSLPAALKFDLPGVQYSLQVNDSLI